MPNAAEALTEEALLPREGKKWHINPDGTKVEIPSTTLVLSDCAIIEPGVQIGVGVCLSGQTHLEKDCEVGNHVKLNSTTVKSGARIGDKSVVDRSTIGRNSLIGECNWVRGGSVVGERVTTGSDVVVKPNAVISDDDDIGPGTWVS